MNDPTLALGWSVVLVGAIGGAVILRRVGLPSTYLRDLLHLGAGVWVLGWPWWDGPVVPVALTALVFAATAAVPWVRTRLGVAARIHEAVTGGEERWNGLVLYTGAYAALTLIGMTGDPLPAAGALLALSLGDGLGGAVGLRFGRHHFRAPGGKEKSLEGSLTVALAAALGALVAAHVLGVELDLVRAGAVGAVASLAEAAAPRGTDNALVPGAAWLALSLMT
jgi:dolichol kinase